MPTLEKFFNSTTSARPLHVCRAAIGLACALRAYLQLGLLRDLYSGNVIPARNFPGLLPDIPPYTVYLAIATSLAFAAGFHTRLTGLLTLAFFLYQFLLDSNLYSNNSYLLTLILFLLILPNYQSSTVPRWQTLLPRLQVTIVYLYSAAFKVNANFLTGQTTATSMRLPAAWLDTPLPALLAIAALLIEFFIPVALWVPRLRPAAFLSGALLHLTIFLGMERIYTAAMVVFGTTMLAPFLLFLEHPPRSRTILYNPDSKFSHHTVRLLTLLDWLHIHNFQPSTTATTSFNTFREVLALQPLTFLWAPLLSIPPINTFSRRIYNHLATRD